MRYPASEKLEIIRLVSNPPAGPPHAGEIGIPQRHILPLVRSVSERRAGSAGGSLASAGSRLEPHSR